MNHSIVNLACITENCPDGQKIGAVEITYDAPLDDASVGCDSFSVEQRRITAVSTAGNVVTVCLDLRDKAAALVPMPDGPKPPKGEKMGPPKGPMKLPAAVRRPVVARVCQCKPVFTADGVEIPGWEADTTQHREPVVEDFSQSEFQGISYNLFCPKVESGTRYPLVVFLHDAGVCGADPKIALSQGNGAVSWADPTWQAEHPCFVLAPQIASGVHLTNDKFEAADAIYTLKAMIDDIASCYPVDHNRIYATGQSMGCMTFCEMNILWPEYFAATLLVAGQWSPERMAEKCAGNRFWILVSNHDAKAFPGMNAVTAALEEAGAKIARHWWDAKLPHEVLEAAGRKAMQEDGNIHYTVFEGSSVVPEDQDDNPATNHMSTWPVAYGITALKTWLFAQKKNQIV